MSDDEDEDGEVGSASATDGAGTAEGSASANDGADTAEAPAVNDEHSSQGGGGEDSESSLSD